MKIIKVKDVNNYVCPVDKLPCLGDECMAWHDWHQYLQNRETIIHKDYGYCSYVNKGENQ